MKTEFVGLLSYISTCLLFLIVALFLGINQQAGFILIVCLFSSAISQQPEVHGNFNFFNFFNQVLVEELFCRWLCIGILFQYLNHNLCF